MFQQNRHCTSESKQDATGRSALRYWQRLEAWQQWQAGRTLNYGSLCCVQALAAEYAVTAMPTFAIIQEGQRVGEVIGADKNKLTDLIARWSSHGQQAQQPARV